MAKQRRKKRTHVRAEQSSGGGGGGKAGTTNRPPRSMVVRMGAGEVGPSVSQLAMDFRAVVEPDTASRLKERKANKLKDYTAMAGPLGVTHLFMFSRSNSGNVHLRMALTPRGPTLTFRIDNYALRKDVANSQKHPRTGGNEYKTAPLLVMNNFTSSTTIEKKKEEAEEGNKTEAIKKQLESLTTTMFQSVFPPISPQNTPLSSIKRILLLNREAQKNGAYVISLRHYAITTRTSGVSKRIRRFDSREQRQKEKKGGAVPNLGKLEDVADYLLDPASGGGGYTSASETEMDTDNEVEVLETSTRKVLSKKEMQKLRDADQKPGGGVSASAVEKRAVKLVELGPRMKLRLVKVEEGICEGRVMWNEFVTKSKLEEKELDDKWDQRRKEKEARRAEQKANVEKKKLLKNNTKANSARNGDMEDSDEPEYDSDEAEEILEREANGEFDEEDARGEDDETSSSGEDEDDDEDDDDAMEE